MSQTTISPELLELNPLITPDGVRLLHQLRAHEHAPRFNHIAGDRLRQDDIIALDKFRCLLRQANTFQSGELPSDEMIDWVKSIITTVPLWKDKIPVSVNLSQQWQELPTMSREDIASHPERLVPLDADLQEMIVYRTAGTTGHALLVPHHARAAASYQPLLERALELWGISVSFDPSSVGCFLIGAQARTVTYPTVLAAWKGTGFVKLNLAVHDWPTATSSQSYFNEFSPSLLTGDPISFSEMLRIGISHRPKAMISTAVAMSNGLRTKLSDAYQCPVIDLYSLTETGPIAVTLPGSESYCVLPHDIFVEAVDKSGRRVLEGERGEITVTGGRNPFLPLIRYRTGDWGRIEHRVINGNPCTLISDLEGREPVLFRASNGSVVNPVDISRVLREFPIVQHEFTQHPGLSCDLTIRSVASVSPVILAELETAIKTLFGEEIEVNIKDDAMLGSRVPGKVLPYKSELLLED